VSTGVRTSNGRSPTAGIPVRRCPRDPGVPIEYVALSAASEPAAPESGYEAGYEAGYAQGEEAAQAQAADEARRARTQLEQAVGALAEAGRSAASAFAERRDELERSVATFAFELVETLVGRELALATNPGRDAVLRALASDDSGLPATVRLHPDDLEALQGAGEGVLDGTRELSVVADASVAPGGAVVQIGSATIDGQLASALQRVRDVLVGSSDEDGAEVGDGTEVGGGGGAS
jgi:flagellar assembly protein FliH